MRIIAEFVVCGLMSTASSTKLRYDDLLSKGFLRVHLNINCSIQFHFDGTLVSSCLSTFHASNSCRNVLDENVLGSS